MSDSATPVAAATMTPDPVLEKLTALGVAGNFIAEIRDTLGATSVEDLANLTESDLTGVGMKPLQVRKLLSALKTTAPVAAPTAATMSTMNFDGILPSVPDDGSWLKALQTGGVLRVEPSTVISAVRAALARRMGLYDIPEKLADAMERFAETSEAPVSPEFFELRATITRRSYSEIFSAIPGFDGKFVTEGRKKQFFARLDEFVWPAITNFYAALNAWQDAWMKGAANPAMMMPMIMAAAGGRSMALPPGMMAPPDTGVLRDAAAEVVNAVNKAFAGMGIQIAAAVAYDASKIRESLMNPQLPTLIGVANRDMMLKQLGIGISPIYPRLETNLTRFVLAIMQAQEQPAGNEELAFFGSLHMLGSQIPWDQLTSSNSTASRPSGIGSGRGRRDDFDETRYPNR